MAIVYRAEDAKHNRLVAIKVMKPEVCGRSVEIGSSARSKLRDRQAENIHHVWL
jgi:hypothetical protein